MRPQGHLAGGVLAGALLARRYPQFPSTAVIAATALAANVPDLDALVPPLLNVCGCKVVESAAAHHYWVTHTPLFWGALTAVLARESRRHELGPAADLAVKTLAVGAATHLVQDMTSNSVAAAWPFNNKHYGLEFDGLGTTATFEEFMRRYPQTRAWRIEWITIIAATLVCAHMLARDHGRRSAASV